MHPRRLMCSPPPTTCFTTPFFLQMESCVAGLLSSAELASDGGFAAPRTYNRRTQTFHWY